MTIGISTDGVKDRILEHEPEKFHEELRAREKELGLRDMVPTHNQDVVQQLKDIEAEKNNIVERMQMERERRLKRTAEERKANQKSFKEKLNMYLAQQERKAVGDYKSRRIVFTGGGFEEYFDTIRMMPCRVLVKEMRETHNGAIEIQQSHTEKFQRNVVVAVADDVDGSGGGDIVMAEAYAGIEVVSNGNVYRILFDSDILCVLEQ